MSNILIEQLQAKLPKTMTIPKEIKQLYEWIEQNGYYSDVVHNDENIRFGCLNDRQKVRESWTDNERNGGTNIDFSAPDCPVSDWWIFQNDLDDDIDDRLCVFAQSGADGSQCAFWLNDDNQLKIVHIGSGSGSALCCVLADNAVDFLRLLAIGYDEICWDDYFHLSPNEYGEFKVTPNLEFQQWVMKTFNVSIPKTALEIVKIPAQYGDENSDDEFCRWVHQYVDF